MLVRKKAAVAVPPSFSVPRGARLSTQEAFGRLLDDIAASEAALAGHAAKLRGRHAENANPEGPQLELRQIPFADMMILNKVDLASAEQAKKVRAWIDGHFSSLRMVEASYCDVPLEILLSVGRFDPARTDLDLRALEHADCADTNCRDEHHGHDHSTTFSTWSFETNRPLLLEALGEAARKLPGNIYRAKGVVYTSDAPDRRAVLRVVGRRVEITLENEWGDRTPRTQIVVIGAAGGIDTRLIEGIFTALPACRPPPRT